MEHGDDSRTKDDALEMKWTGSGVMRNRRLGSLKMRRWTWRAEKMMREARCVDVVDRARAMVDMWKVIE